MPEQLLADEVDSVGRHHFEGNEMIKAFTQDRRRLDRSCEVGNSEQRGGALGRRRYEPQPSPTDHAEGALAADQ